MTLDTEMTSLADAVRKVTKATGQLTIERMIKTLGGNATPITVAGTYGALGNAVRAKTSKTGKMTIAEMTQALLNRSLGTVVFQGTVTGQIQDLAKPIPKGTKVFNIKIKFSNSLSFCAIDLYNVNRNGYVFGTYDGESWEWADSNGNPISELPFDVGQLTGDGLDGTITTISYGGTPAEPTTPTEPAKTVTVLDRAGFTTFGSSTYDLTVTVPNADTKLTVTLTITNGHTGQKATVSVPGTSMTTTISSGNRGWSIVTATLTIPSGQAGSIKSITVDAGNGNALRAVKVVAE